MVVNRKVKHVDANDRRTLLRRKKNAHVASVPRKEECTSLFQFVSRVMAQCFPPVGTAGIIPTNARTGPREDTNDQNTVFACCRLLSFTNRRGFLWCIGGAGAGHAGGDQQDRIADVRRPELRYGRTI